MAIYNLSDHRRRSVSKMGESKAQSYARAVIFGDRDYSITVARSGDGWIWWAKRILAPTASMSEQGTVPDVVMLIREEPSILYDDKDEAERVAIQFLQDFTP